MFSSKARIVNNEEKTDYPSHLSSSYNMYLQVACGKNAGALTCLLDEKGRYGSQDFANFDLTPDFKVSSLIEVHSLLKSNFDLTP